MSTNSTNDIISMLQQWFSKAPALPANIREVLVKITPILALVFGILGILGSLGGLGIMSAFSPMAVFGGASAVSSYGMGFVAALFWLGSSVLMLLAYPGLKAHKTNGWTMMFWSEVVNLAGSVISLSIVSGIIGALISFYLLFQIKSYYK